MAEPIVQVAEVNPGERPLERVAALLTAGMVCSLPPLKDTRANVIEAVKNARTIPLVYQAVILAEIEAIDAKHNLIQVHFHRHGHGAGGNGCWTVKEVQ